MLLRAIMGDTKELILKITGIDVYGNLKYESRTHRVQRVPNTETRGVYIHQLPP